MREAILLWFQNLWTTTVRHIRAGEVWGFWLSCLGTFRMMFLVDRKGDIFFGFLRALMAYGVLWEWIEFILEEARLFGNHIITVTSGLLPISIEQPLWNLFLRFFS